MMEILYIVTLLAVVAGWRYYRNKLKKLEIEFADHKIITEEKLSILVKDIIKIRDAGKKKKESKKKKTK